MAIYPTLRRQLIEAIVHRLNVDRAPDIPQALPFRWFAGHPLNRLGVISVWKDEESPAVVGRSAKTGNAGPRTLQFVTQIVRPCQPETAELINDAAEGWIVSRLAEYEPGDAVSRAVHQFIEIGTKWELIGPPRVENLHAVTSIIWTCEFQTLSSDLTNPQ